MALVINRTNSDEMKLLGNSQREDRDPDGFLCEKVSSKWKSMDISDAMDLETSTKEKVSGIWNKSYLVVSLLSIAMIIVYFSLSSNDVTVIIIHGTNHTKIDALEIESYEALLQTKNETEKSTKSVGGTNHTKIDAFEIESCAALLQTKNETEKPTKSVGSCETSGRNPYRKKVKDVPKMKSDVNLISYNGTFDSVKRFVMFFASSRSGHTWLGAILDSAPNAMIANQRNILHDYFEDERYKTREDLYTLLAYNSYHCGKSGWLQVYDYTIPGLWQGGIDSSESAQLEVIGDKSGKLSTLYIKQWIEEVTGEDFDFIFGDYDSYPELVPHVNSRFNEFLSVIRNEPRFIANLRHPGSMLATMISRHYKGSQELHAEEVDWVLTCIRTNLWMMEHIGKKEQWHLVITEEFAMNTEAELTKLCEFVDLSCPELMIDKVVEQTRHTVHETWRNLNWDKEHLDIYNKFITKYLLDWYQPMCV